MFHRSLTCAALLSVFLFSAPLRSGSADPPGVHEKTVWNYDGGLLIVTDGNVPNGGPCFRLTGRLTSDDSFFDNLRRVESTTGTFYKRGNDVITEFPERMRLSFLIYDHPCAGELQQTGTRSYLTKALISTFRIGFSWKRGMEMRPAKEIQLKRAEAHQIPSFAHGMVADLPEHYEWWFEFDVPSKEIPLTDSLVLVIYAADGHAIARVAGRM